MTQMFVKPLGHRIEFDGMIIHARHQTGSDLKPALSLVIEMKEGLEYRTQLGSGLLNIEGIGKRLEVHTDRLHALEIGFSKFSRHGTRRQRHPPKAALLAGFKKSGIEGFTVPRRRVIESDGLNPVAIKDSHEVAWTQSLSFGRTEGRAPGSAKTQHWGSRMKVVKRERFHAFDLPLGASPERDKGRGGSARHRPSRGCIPLETEHFTAMPMQDHGTAPLKALTG